MPPDSQPDSELLDLVARTFAKHGRPHVFTDADHCCECAEHNETLSAHTFDSISITEVGNAAWDPICFATDPAYLYFFPALARLALDGRGDAFYLDQFLSHLGRRIDLFDSPERRAVATLLWRLLEKFDGDSNFTDFDVSTLETCLARLEPKG